MATKPKRALLDRAYPEKKWGRSKAGVAWACLAQRS